MTHFATSFNSKVEQVDVEGISPFASLGIYIGAQMQWRGWCEGGDDRCLEGVEQLRGMLSVFKGRWRSAGEFCLLLLWRS